MLMGAFFAAWGADITGSWLLGSLIGVLAGHGARAVHAFFSINLRADQIVSGFALNFVALGLTGYLYVDIYGDQGTPDDLPAVPNLKLPLPENLGSSARRSPNQNLLVWGAARARRGRRGRRVPDAGRPPAAVGRREPAGGRDRRASTCYRTRWIAVLVSGGLAALGGAFLSIGFVHSFTQNMTAGRGYIALAAMISGAGEPLGLLAATLLFGFSSALAQRLPEFSPSGATLFQALPYVLTLIAVAGLVGRSVPPLALGRPLERS